MMQNPDGDQPFAAQLTRRTFIAGGSAGLATTALGSIAAAQTAVQQERTPVNDPEQNNLPLLKENRSSNDPLQTDHGDTGPIWYSFNLAHKREESGG
jgi:oxalate decarboxylase